MVKRQVVTLEELKKENRYSGVLPVWVGDYPTQVIPTIELIYTKLCKLKFGLIFPTPTKMVNFDSEYYYENIKTCVEIIASRRNVLILFVIPRYQDSGLTSNGLLDVMTGYSLGLFNACNSAIYIQDDLFGIGDDMVLIDGVSVISDNRGKWFDNDSVFKDFLSIKKYVWENPYTANEYDRDMWYHILYCIYNSPLHYYEYYSLIEHLDDFIYKGKKEEILTEVRIDIEKHISKLIKHILKSLCVTVTTTAKCSKPSFVKTYGDIIYDFNLDISLANGDNLYKIIVKKYINRYLESKNLINAGFNIIAHASEPDIVNPIYCID